MRPSKLTWLQTEWNLDKKWWEEKVVSSGENQGKIIRGKTREKRIEGETENEEMKGTHVSTEPNTKRYGGESTTERRWKGRVEKKRWEVQWIRKKELHETGFLSVRIESVHVDRVCIRDRSVAICRQWSALEKESLQNINSFALRCIFRSLKITHLIRYWNFYSIGIRSSWEEH